jgi:hypothetical protein
MRDDSKLVNKLNNKFKLKVNKNMDNIDIIKSFEIDNDQSSDLHRFFDLLKYFQYELKEYPS